MRREKQENELNKIGRGKDRQNGKERERERHTNRQTGGRDREETGKRESESEKKMMEREKMIIEREKKRQGFEVREGEAELKTTRERRKKQC